LVFSASKQAKQNQKKMPRLLCPYENCIEKLEGGFFTKQPTLSAHCVKAHFSSAQVDYFLKQLVKDYRGQTTCEICQYKNHYHNRKLFLAHWVHKHSDEEALEFLGEEFPRRPDEPDVSPEELAEVHRRVMARKKNKTRADFFFVKQEPPKTETKQKVAPPVVSTEREEDWLINSLHKEQKVRMSKLKTQHDEVSKLEFPKKENDEEYENDDEEDFIDDGYKSGGSDKSHASQKNSAVYDPDIYKSAILDDANMLQQLKAQKLKLLAKFDKDNVDLLVEDPEVFFTKRPSADNEKYIRYVLSLKPTLKDMEEEA